MIFHAIPFRPLEHQSPGKDSWLHHPLTFWAAHRGSEKPQIDQIPVSRWNLCHNAGSGKRSVRSTHSLRSADKHTKIWTMRGWINVTLYCIAWLELRKENTLIFPTFPPASYCSRPQENKVRCLNPLSFPCANISPIVIQTSVKEHPMRMNLDFSKKKRILNKMYIKFSTHWVDINLTLYSGSCKITF